jgi:hypothetical protein
MIIKKVKSTLTIEMAPYLIKDYLKKKEIFSIKENSMNPYEFFEKLENQKENKEYYYYSQDIKYLGN